MSKNRYRPKPSGRLRIGFLPVLIWVLAAAAAVTLFWERFQNFEMVGIAQANQIIIAANGPGRLKSMSVELFKAVQAGEPLAILQLNSPMGDENLQEQLLTQRATALAELERLQAELTATADRLENENSLMESDAATAHRRMVMDVEQARLTVLQLKTTLAPEQILLEDLDLEIDINRKLVEKGALEQYALDKLNVQHQAQQAKVDEQKNMLEQAQKNLRQAELRLDEYVAKKPTPLNLELAMEPLRKAITVQEKRLDELMAMRPTTALVAPFDAVVSMINCREHQTVMEGDPIMTIVNAQPQDVITYVPQDKIDRVFVNMEVKLIKQTRPQRIVTSQITHLGPSVEMIPQRLWINPDVPEYGLPVRIAYDSNLGLLPNEMVGVRL
ncbi:MAG: HlyD family efflux transporter periplasmic adaptor subunit [Sedimentisphaerales bacterium]|nr:HlyD family efflux transporter periplasmic adaptor subunit [Sedimentisphaerales bacterium]